jgi:hypothetical protein
MSPPSQVEKVKPLVSGPGPVGRFKTSNHCAIVDADATSKKRARGFMPGGQLSSFPAPLPPRL